MKQRYTRSEREGEKEREKRAWEKREEKR